MNRALLALPLLALASACAAPERVSAPAPLPVAPPVRVAAPSPPDGAAAGLAIPARLADGSYATPNRAPSPAAAMWHLRAAFNVAALSCSDDDGAMAYNRMLAAHRRDLAAAHRELAAQHGDRFDPVMTRLYNYFAQPPVMAQFCAAALPLLREATTLPAGEFATFAPRALAAVDRPFTEFYTRYDAWRIDLAAWQRGESAVPQLRYDTAVFEAVPTVTGGTQRLAAR